uniref:Uncharacterized protein n=1 Tax=Hyaloperonospora arabidopsidis (strain Emoy2) TaxID=559515 RepID=M4BSW9_HYAAE
MDLMDMSGEESRRALAHRRNSAIEWGRGPVRVMLSRAKVQTSILSYAGLVIMSPLRSRIQGFADHFKREPQPLDHHWHVSLFKHSCWEWRRDEDDKVVFLPPTSCPLSRRD